MTDRVRSITVALDHDIREDDVQLLVDAIRMMRHVSAVTTNVVSPNDWATEMNVKMEVRKKLSEFSRSLF